jgi:hypothetical protein
MSKITLTPIALKDLKPLIQMAFRDDPLLLTKYSLLKTEDHTPTLEESVDKNYETILEAYNDPVFKDDVNIYAIEISDKDYTRPIGFTVTITNAEAPHILLSFGINIMYRNLKNSTKWLMAVKGILGKYITTFLHVNNSRAIEFFEKNGFTKKVNELDVSNVTLTSNWKEVVKHAEKKEAVAHL